MAGPSQSAPDQYQSNLHNYWNLNCNEDTKTGPSPGCILIQHCSRRLVITPAINIWILSELNRGIDSPSQPREVRVNKFTWGELLMNIMHNEDV